MVDHSTCGAHDADHGDGGVPHFKEVPTVNFKSHARHERAGVTDYTIEQPTTCEMHLVADSYYYLKKNKDATKTSNAMIEILADVNAAYGTAAFDMNTPARSEQTMMNQKVQFAVAQITVYVSFTGSPWTGKHMQIDDFATIHLHLRS
jgi:hypothetical protein